MQSNTTTTTHFVPSSSTTTTSSSSLFDILNFTKPIFTKLSTVVVFPFLSGVFSALGEYSMRFMYSKFQQVSKKNNTTEYDPLETFVTNGRPLNTLKRKKI
ncbi:hypothetical protein FDP41_002801 [Naegleria fowleri]|uniref:Uncharacterized protein n=1 Tax=Naegleria fowleri TaxID=5763 RepID=A0A6A5BSY1_NAEFO|nr:uncharacterized protein FDP41_002801 [Naegleria fowleri]KAF0978286.1 hypothetical protein FDP41_002801 [Naegleria fowleri]CAG4710607.1 unnamed protein product [Naegleria fowleri]